MPDEQSERSSGTAPLPGRGASAVDMRAALGRLLLDEGQVQPAQRIFQEVLRRHTKLGTDEPHLAFTLHGLGASLLALGRIDEALTVLERGYRARPAANDSNPELRADLDFALARALRARATDRERACALGREAAGVYRRMSTFARELREAERWLARESCAHVLSGQAFDAFSPLAAQGKG